MPKPVSKPAQQPAAKPRWKPTPLQVRNILVAILMAAGLVWNLANGSVWWLPAIFAMGCALAIASAVINRNGLR
ncbi:MAG: putative rane protein [Amycolatopsis sp.]|jgi:hypothetical protein|uniref:hypothetical protein n=1 Tax=Amycolatopsis sp. TaxID=37632 RepID=UPI003459E85F|nr:putative rane protein [Amycolatopsis sp.]